MNKYETVDRDISWMYFNHRILQEAQRPNVPLLERVSFLGIYSNNLDEFFRVRMATLNRIAESADRSMMKEYKHVQSTLRTLNKLNVAYAEEYSKTVDDVITQLDKEKIHFVDPEQATESQIDFVKKFFFQKMVDCTIPLFLNPLNSLTSGTDQNIYLAIKLSYYPKGKKHPVKDYAVVRIPSDKFGRFLQLPNENGESYLMYMDDVVRIALPWIFAGMPFTRYEAYAFKFTKDAEMEIENNLNYGKLQKIKKGIISRRKGNALRFIYDKNMPKEMLKKVSVCLNLDKLDTFLPGGRYHNHKDFMSLPDCGRKDLKFPTWTPVSVPEFTGKRSVLDVIAQNDRLVHVPYESFECYLRFLREAALNPKVRYIKTTLYRLAKDSKVVEALIAAAKNGKKVTVVIELLARFDEESNVDWSNKLQEAGVDVQFGVDGLKIHSKVTLVGTSTQMYACIGTGNFHEGNARCYTDCMLFTASKTITKDVERLFQFVKSPFLATKFKELMVSPNEMATKVLALINKEIKNRRTGKNAYIKVKINHITDEVVVKKLYEAAAEGVKVDLLVRGNCALVPTIPELNGNMRIVGIIDRFLEHSRILIFCNDDDPLYFIGSSDWMPRNLYNRIEVMTPIYNRTIQKDLERIVNDGLNDTMQGRIVDGTDKNHLPIMTQGVAPFRSQASLCNYYIKKNNPTSSNLNEQDTPQKQDEE